MKTWHRYTLTIVLGLAAGASLAVYRVRGGLAAGQVTNGPWATAKTYGSTDADALTRARVALSGLLALPAKEAMYFTAKTDSEGAQLDGRCLYRVHLWTHGWRPEMGWWSLTLYEGDGWLVANSSNTYSVGSEQFRKLILPPGVVGPKTFPVAVGPDSNRKLRSYPLSISTGGVARYELTLRIYHPGPEILYMPEQVGLPEIERVSC